MLGFAAYAIQFVKNLFVVQSLSFSLSVYIYIYIYIDIIFYMYLYIYIYLYIWMDVRVPFGRADTVTERPVYMWPIEGDTRLVEHFCQFLFWRHPQINSCFLVAHNCSHFRCAVSPDIRNLLDLQLTIRNRWRCHLNPNAIHYVPHIPAHTPRPPLHRLCIFILSVSTRSRW